MDKDVNFLEGEAPRRGGWGGGREGEIERELGLGFQRPVSRKGSLQNEREAERTRSND